MLISSCQYVEEFKAHWLHAFMYHSNARVFFFFYHAHEIEQFNPYYLQPYDDMTLYVYYQIYTYLFLRLPLAACFPCLKMRVLQPTWQAAQLCHHTILLNHWIRHKVECKLSTRHFLLLMRIPIEDFDDPHSPNASS